MGSYGSMGGYGSLGGYGGLGGYSPLGAGYGGLGCYGGMYNRFGMGLGPDGLPQQGFLRNTMQYLDSFGFCINSLGEIARTLEFHADGILKFWESLKSLLQRIKGFGDKIY